MSDPNEIVAEVPAPGAEVTDLLLQASRGDVDALDRVVPLVYAELRRRAEVQMRGERDGHTLGTTGLLHEALLRLREQDRARWANRGQFFAVASLTMRRVLVNWARDRSRLKRGGAAQPVTLDEAGMRQRDRDPDPMLILAVDQALNRLRALSVRAARVVECRYFADLSVAETAEALEISPATVKREWALARSWLERELDLQGSVGE